MSTCRKRIHFQIYPRRRIGFSWIHHAIVCIVRVESTIVYPVLIVICGVWIVIAVSLSLVRGVRGARHGRLPLAIARLKSPTIYLFAAYVFVAAIVTPPSAGETTSPLMWLSFCIPVANALAVFSSVGKPQPSRSEAFVLALIHGGAMVAAAALILAVVSPRFVPVWLGGPSAPVTTTQ
jgi:hypothetical protein